MKLTELEDRVQGAETFLLYAVNLHTSPPRDTLVVKFTANNTAEAVDAVVEDMLEDGHEADYFPARLLQRTENDVVDITRDLSTAMFDCGVIKLTPVKEGFSKGNTMKNINENTKVTLTVGQLKKLVSETKEKDILVQLREAQEQLNIVRAKYKARQGLGLIREELKKAQNKVNELKKQAKELQEARSGVDAFMQDDLRRYTVDFKRALEKLSHSSDRETARHYNELLDALEENPRMLNSMARSAFKANAFSVEEIKRFIEFGRRI